MFRAYPVCVYLVLLFLLIFQGYTGFDLSQQLLPIWSLYAI